MKEVSQFSLGAPPSWGLLREYRRHLMVGGKQLRVIYGDKLQRQFQCGAGFLVITSYDYFEGTHHWFYLLDMNGSVIDRATTPDYFGFIERVHIEDSSSLSFGFFGTNDCWSLTVRDQRNGGLSIVRRLSCFLLGRRRLVLRCTQGAPWSLPEAQQCVAADRAKPRSG